MRRVLLWILCLTAPCAAWQMQTCPLVTPWAADVDPKHPWPEHPRPQMQRHDWTNLNGLWDYAITPVETEAPEAWEGQILVPFCVESALSGVKRSVGAERALWYRRRIKLQPRPGHRVLLHFEAVDWQATVTVNGTRVGRHQGGYSPFTCDITDALAGRRQEIRVRVWDPTDRGTQPRGKQVCEPGGIWYTAVTGIWQTVWLEVVPETHLATLEVAGDLAARQVRVTATATHPRPGLTVTTRLEQAGRTVGTVTAPAGQPLHVDVPHPRPWSPGHPHLYRLTVTLRENGRPLDEVTSYTTLRTLGIAPDARGIPQFQLNGQRIFQLGTLDQGWWPEGLYTAPTDAALAYDLQVLKDLGFNTLRKHVKVEPARFYYHCDRLGLLVWQDIPNGNRQRGEPNSLRVGVFGPDALRPADSAAQFEAELAEIIRARRHFPCIALWVPFNEGWGQYATTRILERVRQLDPTRPVDLTSGWSDRGIGDVEDAHEYPGPGLEPVEPNRVAVLGEFGGLGWPVPGHLWWDKRNWGYRNYARREELNDHYRRIVGALRGPLGLGLGAAIYTQTTDVEGEVNGLMTYDRRVIKLDVAQAAALHRSLLAPPPRARILLPTSEQVPQTWRYRLGTAPPDWTDPRFDDRNWAQGPGTFQSGQDTGFPQGTVWTRGRLYLRRRFRVHGVPDNLWLQLYQNTATTEIALNGEVISRWEGERANRRHYRHVDLSDYAHLLVPDENVLTVTADQARGPRGIDVGLYCLDAR